ncbi:S58 family peptidase [Marinicauda algicola]|uniref:S58 family peptidase n=1 Tax=Marinicauda algicola TaxID=2029849 RepID=A0A4V3RXU0_9PROT|nr:P1 family peptidase [Marinicauda algicola]TGY87899.1 S58 family peptidase [Marinicauda algicola]
MKAFACALLAAGSLAMAADAQERVRARDIGLAPGILEPGPLNAITDVAGVRVGHVTLIEEPTVRTGVTAILPHGGDLFADKVPAGVVVGNGYGKMMGISQIEELGEIETPILLTNTLAVPRAADAILDWTLSRPGNAGIGSVNMVVGETNDGGLNDIRARVVTPAHGLEAIESASTGPVGEGAVGAGAGTIAFGWKGGIGTSSRALPESLGGYTLGVLVQSNFGGVLVMDGLPVGERLGHFYLSDHVADDRADGSIMIVVATDAPLSDRNLTRLARRALAGLARTGASMTNGSGDYVIAFSTAEAVRRTPERRSAQAEVTELANSAMSPLFQAVIEATEEAILNSLLMAQTASYRRPDGSLRTVEALPVDRVRAMVAERDSQSP